MSKETCADPKWRVGPGALGVDDLVLLSLHRASYGTWVMSISVILGKINDAGMQE